MKPGDGAEQTTTRSKPKSQNETDDFLRLPHAITDRWQPKLPPADFSIVMVVSRETFGWQRAEAKITNERFMRRTGLSQPTVTAAVARLMKRGLLLRRTQQVGRVCHYFYSLNVGANLRALTPQKRAKQLTLPTDDVRSFPQARVKESLVCDAPKPTGINFFGPSRPVLIDLKKGGEKENLLPTHTVAPQQNAEPERVCASKHSKETIDEYAWAVHNHMMRWNSFNPRQLIGGIKNPTGWARIAARTTEFDDDIQHWLDDPSLFDWRKVQMIL